MRQLNKKKKKQAKWKNQRMKVQIGNGKHRAYDKFLNIMLK